MKLMEEEMDYQVAADVPVDECAREDVDPARIRSAIAGLEDLVLRARRTNARLEIVVRDTVGPEPKIEEDSPEKRARPERAIDQVRDLTKLALMEIDRANEMISSLEWL